MSQARKYSNWCLRHRCPFQPKFSMPPNKPVDQMWFFFLGIKDFFWSVFFSLSLSVQVLWPISPSCSVSLSVSLSLSLQLELLLWYDFIIGLWFPQGTLDKLHFHIFIRMLEPSENPKIKGFVRGQKTNGKASKWPKNGRRTTCRYNDDFFFFDFFMYKKTFSQEQIQDDYVIVRSILCFIL